MGKVLKGAWEKYVPTSIRLPGGYVVQFRVLSAATIARKMKGEAVGVWTGFGGCPEWPIDDEKRGLIVLSREQSMSEFIDTLQHEVHHAVTDWGAGYAAKIREGEGGRGE